MNSLLKEFPKTYDASSYEDEIYKEWESKGFFNPDNTLDKNAKSYTIVMPPPNVTGTLHLGHTAMLALEDILVRYHRMLGERSLWLPGTDHAAIATQTKVEKIIKEEGTNRHEMGREKFLERVKAFAQDSHDTIANQTRKIGSSCDWSREAYTLDETRSKAVKSVFKMMYDDGLVFRGERIVNWCPRCKSTLADDEVEYKAQKAKLYYFKYDKNFPITIATTRPETKLGDTAVAVNPKDERYKEFIGQEYEVDFCGCLLKIKIIADRNIEMDFGTGALGVTPAHSAVDWKMAQENNLEIVKVISEDGLIKDGFGDFSQKDVYSARKMIVEELEKRGLIEKIEEIDNNLSICYRCDTAIEPLPSLQWFIDVNKKIVRRENKSIKELSIEAVKSGVFGREKINIFPERFEKNYFHWMENLGDWCISRQILFGHQVPVWYKKNDKITNYELRITNDLVDEEIYVGVEAPEGDDWVQDMDTLDTWFSSGLWTFSTLAKTPEQIRIENGNLIIDSEDFKNFHPTQVLETGYDIIFFWVARMIIMTTYAIGDIPFQDVYLHGLVLDEKGKKMSKSKGNSIDPLDMIPKYGTDAVRLSLVIGSTQGNDLKMSEEKIASNRNLINKLWNIARYISQVADFSQTNLEFYKQDFSLADYYILEKMQNLIVSVRNDLNQYRFSQAGESLRGFTWDDLADWYLEASKFEKNETKNKILAFIFKDLLKLWHPFIPFVTETIWQKLGFSQLIISKYPEADFYNNLLTEKSENNFEFIKNIIVCIRNARSENKIEPARKVQAVLVTKKYQELIKSQVELIKGMKTGIDDLKIVKSFENEKEAIHLVFSNLEIYLLGGIDEEKEKVRKEKQKENLKKMIEVIEQKLNNKEFVEKAPKTVVLREQENLKKLKEKFLNI